MREHLLVGSNRFLLLMSRVAPGLAQAILNGIGVDALKHGARRTAA